MPPGDEQALLCGAECVVEARPSLGKTLVLGVLAQVRRGGAERHRQGHPTASAAGDAQAIRTAQGPWMSAIRPSSGALNLRGSSFRFVCGRLPVKMPLSASTAAGAISALESIERLNSSRGWAQTPLLGSSASPRHLVVNDVVLRGRFEVAHEQRGDDPDGDEAARFPARIRHFVPGFVRERIETGDPDDLDEKASGDQDRRVLDGERLGDGAEDKARRRYEKVPPRDGPPAASDGLGDLRPRDRLQAEGAKDAEQLMPPPDLALLVEPAETRRRLRVGL